MARTPGRNYLGGTKATGPVAPGTPHRMLSGADVVYTPEVIRSGKIRDLSHLHWYGTPGAPISLASAQFAGYSFAHSRLVHVDFTGADLSRVSFLGAYLVECTFDRAQLREANFSHATLEGCSFVQAVADYANFDHGRIWREGPGMPQSPGRRNRFDQARLANSSWNSTKIRATDFTGADLTAASMDLSDCAHITLNEVKCTAAISISRCNWHSITVRKSHLVLSTGDSVSGAARIEMLTASNSVIRGDLSHIRLTGPRFSECDLSTVILNFAQLTETSYGSVCSFEFCNFSNASFASALLHGSYIFSNFTNAYMPRAQLGRADLGACDFTGADLREVYFVASVGFYGGVTHSRVDDATFAGADLTGAVLPPGWGVDSAGKMGPVKPKRPAAPPPSSTPEEQWAYRTQTEHPLQLLGFPREAKPTPAEIKQAYRALANQYHPDRPGGSLAIMQFINGAYQAMQQRMGFRNNPGLRASRPRTTRARHHS